MRQSDPCSGYREACDCARSVLEAGAFNHAADPAVFRQDLLNIAKTTLSSKILTVVRPWVGCRQCRAGKSAQGRPMSSVFFDPLPCTQDKEHFANLAVDAILRLKVGRRDERVWRGSFFPD
jgi:T-complex protein 1 subunit beta